MTPEPPPGWIDLLVLGGTATMSGSGGLRPALGAQDLLSALPADDSRPEIRAETLAQAPSASLTFGHIAQVIERIERSRARGALGVVVVQGTDTLEEVAFVVDMALPPGAPVVLTGAMRGPIQPGADGPANLLAAIVTAASREARDLGAVVVMNDEIHPAAFVSKRHASRPDAFETPNGGPLGLVSENRVRLFARPAWRSPTVLLSNEPPPVALIGAALGADARMLSALRDQGFAGTVIEGFGAGHLPAAWVEPAAELARHMPVVLASSTGAGVVLERTYGYPGSERDLLGRGLISSGPLSARKARLLMMLLLGAGVAPSQVARCFAEIEEGTNS